VLLVKCFHEKIAKEMNFPTKHKMQLKFAAISAIIDATAKAGAIAHSRKKFESLKVKFTFTGKTFERMAALSASCPK